MKIIDFYSLAGNMNKHNEDKIGFSHNSVWLMDGATPMQQTISNPYGSDAAWFVNCLDRELKKQANLGLFFGLKRALKNVSDNYKENNHSNENLEQHLMPSCQYASIEYVKNTDYIHFSTIGDTRVLVKYKNKKIEVFGETLLDKIDEDNLSKVKEIESKQKINSISERINLAKNLLNESKKNYMNKENGFQTLTPDVNSLKGLSLFVEHVREVEKILMATDGLLSIVEKYNAMTYEEMFETIEENGIEYLAKVIRDIEEKDPNGNTYYRFKKSDDTSGVLVSFD